MRVNWSNMLQQPRNVDHATSLRAAFSFAWIIEAEFEVAVSAGTPGTVKVSNQSLKKDCWTPTPANGGLVAGDPGPNGVQNPASATNDESFVSATGASPQASHGNGRLIRSMAMQQVRLVFSSGVGCARPAPPQECWLSGHQGNLIMHQHKNVCRRL